MILAAGVLRATESNIGSTRTDWQPFGAHVGSGSV